MTPTLHAANESILDAVAYAQFVPYGRCARLACVANPDQAVGRTGLPGWTLLIDRVAVAIARVQRAENQVGVFVIVEPRLPNKPYEALQVVEALQSRLRPDDSLARLGPQRDAIVCYEIHRDQDAAQIAHRLVYGAGLQCGLGIAFGAETTDPKW